MKLNSEQIKRYLEKINFTDEIALDYNTLAKLQLAHLKYIPYENIDIINEIPLSLTIDDLYLKMIVNNRGGYCFETNTLYAALLRSLGFIVTSYTGRYIPNETDLQMRRHRILKVETNDGIFISDVGVRVELPRLALYYELDTIQNDGVSDYMFTFDNFFGTILWQRHYNKSWKKVYGFTNEPQAEIDYIMPSFFCEKHLDSPFVNTLYLSLFTDEAHLSLTNNVYKVFKAGEVVEKKTINTSEELLQVCSDTFKVGIDAINILKIDF